MGTRLSFIKLLPLFFLLSYGARANEPLIPLDFSGHYDFAMAGIPFGGMDIDFSQSATRYRATSNVAITGIARLFVQHESHTTSSGSGQNFHYPNVEYESRYQTRGKKRYVHFIKKNDVIVSEKVEPPDNRAIRPAVDKAAKSKAFDPLALAPILRTELAHALTAGKKQFALSFYDGRRLTRIDFTVREEKVIRLQGKKYPVYHVTARRKALAGYTQKELARLAPKEPDLSIYFSHDARLVPILIEYPLPFGMVTATLNKI